MAGNPKRRRIEAALEKFTRELMDADATWLDYVCELVSSGRTLDSLVSRISSEIHLDLHRGALTNVLKRHFGDEVQPRLRAARQEAAHVLVEEALDIVDSADETPSAVAKAKLRADSRLWIAARYNRTDLGDTPAAALQINVGSLHLDAMRRVASEHQRTRVPANSSMQIVAKESARQELPSGELVTDVVTGEADFTVESSEPTT